MAKDSANNGFIVIDRSILDWQHFTEPVVLQVFLYLLFRANDTNGWWEGLACERGASFVSIRTIANECKCSLNTVQRALRILEESGEIKRIKIDQKHTKTIVCKCCVYQSVEEFCVSNSDTLTDTPIEMQQTKVYQSVKEFCVSNSDTLTDTQDRKKKKEPKKKKDNNIVDVEKQTRARAREEIDIEALSRSIYLEPFLAQERLNKDQFMSLAKSVLAEWELTEKTHTSATDARTHLFSQVRIKAKAMREQGLLTDTEQRRKDFAADCRALIEQGYPESRVTEFYHYWMQPLNDGTGRLNFEGQKAWDTKTRFIKNLKRAK